MNDKPQPELTGVGLLSCQVCVPESWTNEQIREFAERENPCGTTSGWHVRTGSDVLQGDLERAPCSDREGFVHVCLDA